MHGLSAAVPQSSSVLHRLRDPQARVPLTRKRVPLGSSAYCMSTPAGPDPQTGALASLVTAAPAALRNENLCIIPALEST